MRIDSEFRTLIPPLSKEEFEQLEQNCLKDGIRDSLIVWDDNGEFVLIDGHNRYEIAQKHNLPYSHRRMEFPNREAVIEWIIRNQFGRRNLSAYDRSILALKLKPLIAAEAKERMALAPQKKAERDKEIQEIWDSFDFDTARNLVAAKKQAYAREDRAKTMASEKYIYFARFDSDKVKVGSSVNPDERVKQLSVSCPDISLIEAVPYGEGAEKHENSLKTKYSQYRIGNECYQCSDQVLSEMIAFTRKEAKRKDNTDYKLAKVAGVSHDTIHKVETIEKKAPEEVKEAIRRGDMSINKVYTDIIASEHETIRQEEERKLREAKKRHEDFVDQKNEGVVSLDAARQDKEDGKVLFEELQTYFTEAANKVFYLGGKQQSGELQNLLENGDHWELRDLYQKCERMHSTTIRLMRAIGEVIEKQS